MCSFFFTADGHAIIKGFDHELPVSPHARERYEVWPGIYDSAPSTLMTLLKDESVEHEEVTFCCWSDDGRTWRTGSADIPEGLDDGSSWLLDMVQMNADDFIEWGKAYYDEGFERLGCERVLEVFRNLQIP